MGRIERAPDWILKYEEGIKEGTSRVEEILEAENRIRAVPIKLSTVTRAINAMGHPITGLSTGEVAEAATMTEQHEKSGARSRIERGPDWLQKYRDVFVNGTITVEGILEAENRIRAVPIKLSTVTRAINAMGHPITGLRAGEVAEAATMTEQHEKGGARNRIERGPGWLQKYRDGIENRTITAEEILEAENRIRAAPIKLPTVTRAINAMGYPLIGLRTDEMAEEAAIEKKVAAKIETSHRPEISPYWIRKYSEKIEGGTITVEGILEAENRIHTVPIKLSTITRAINLLRHPVTDLVERRKPGIKRGEGVYSSSIGKISESTANKFNSIKNSWEKELGKSMHEDYFLNILLALAKLVGHGKTVAPAK